MASDDDKMHASVVVKHSVNQGVATAQNEDGRMKKENEI